MLYKKDFKALRDLKKDLKDILEKYRKDLDDLEELFNVENIDHYDSCKCLKTRKGSDCNCEATNIHCGNNEILALQHSLWNLIDETTDE